MLCVISVVDSISATSMPINEFVIYRSKHSFNMRQILIVCDERIPSNISIPEDVEVILTGTNKRKIKNATVRILNRYKGDDVVFHLHHQKSALLFLFSTIGTGVRKHSLYTVHSTFSARDLKYKISSCLCVLISKYANCVSYSAFREYALWVKKIKGKNFFVIKNGVDVDRIDKIIQRNFMDSDRKTLICVGRMIPLKNHEFLIRLMEKLSDYKLILVGEEDKEGKIRALVNELKMNDRIEFTGLISREDVFKKLTSASIYVSASKVEGLPISVLEAMRAGLIPVISEIEPHKEIAWKCEYVNVLPLIYERWLTTIEYYGELNQKEFDKQSDTIKKYVNDNFSLEKMHNQYLLVYKKLI